MHGNLISAPPTNPSLILVFVLFRNQSPPFFILSKGQLLRLQLFPGHNHVHHECRSDDKPRGRKEDVDWHRVPRKGTVRQGVQTVLGEVHEPGDADDRPIDAAKGGKSKDFGGVVSIRE